MVKITVHKTRAAVVVKRHNTAGAVIVKKPGAPASALLPRGGGPVQKRRHAGVAKHLKLELLEFVSSLADPGRARKTVLEGLICGCTCGRPRIMKRHDLTPTSGNRTSLTSGTESGRHTSHPVYMDVDGPHSMKRRALAPRPGEFADLVGGLDSDRRVHRPAHMGVDGPRTMEHHVLAHPPNESMSLVDGPEPGRQMSRLVLMEVDGGEGLRPAGRPRNYCDGDRLSVQGVDHLLACLYEDAVRRPA